MSVAPSSVILASAGTGKTYQLTSRYVALLTGGVEPARILATTFTRHAAGQIFDRIVARLLESVETGGDSANARVALARLLRGVDRLGIGTLDSFFAKLATGYATELGLPPGWRMVDDDEDERLRARAVELTLEDGDRRDMLALLQLLMAKRFRSSIAGSLLGAVADAHAVFQSADERAWDVIDVPSGLRSMDDAAMREIARAWEDVPLHLTGAGDVNKVWARAHQNAIAQALGGDWEGLVVSGLPEKILRNLATFSKGAITDAVRIAYQPLLEHATHALLTRHVASTRALRQLLERFDRAYWALKREHRAYRFEDVPRLLSGMDGALSLDEIAFRLDGSIDHVLLDEFQDTSAAQFALIEPLLEEILSGGGGKAENAGERSVFCVGDLKQSLYQWRNAEPGLFAALPTRWPQLEVSQLDVSYRSSPVVLGAVNGVFQDITRNVALAEHHSVAAAWQEAFRPHQAAETLRTSPGFVRLVAAPTAPEGVPQATWTLIAAVDRVAEIVGLNANVSIGVLVRGKKRIPRLIFELKHRGIEASEEGGNPLTDAPAVAAALSALQLADHPGDSAAAFHVATSPLTDVLCLHEWRSDAARSAAAARIRADASTLGYARLIAGWLDAIAPACDARDVRRFEQLIDLAEQFDARNDPRAEHLVQMVRSRRVDDPTAHAVRVMTVHASKGLEFDAVILPDLDGKIAARPPAILYQRSNPFSPIDAVTRYANDALRLVDQRLAALYEVHRDRTIAEELCVLYVAMTRARHALEMVIAPSASRPKGNAPEDTDPRVAEQLPLTHAGILRGALAPGLRCAPGVLYEVGDPAWHEGVASEAPAAQRPEMKITLATDGRSPRPRRAKPPARSSIDAVAIDSPLIARVAPGVVDRGRLIHAWLEHVEWLDDGELDIAMLIEIARGLRLDPGVDIAGEARRLAQMLGAAEVRGVLSRSRYSSTEFGSRVRVLREVPFAFRREESSGTSEDVESGRIDRLVLGMDASGSLLRAEVIDFKTDAIFPGVTLEALVDRHRAQIESYRLAAARLTGLAATKVSGTLVLLSVGRVVLLAEATGEARSGSA